MTNKVIEFSPKFENNLVKNRRKNGFFKSIKLITFKGDTKIDLRFYCTNTKVYACIWIACDEEYLMGGGSAGGSGYCKLSAASAAALRDCGIELQQSINAAGEEAVNEALYAIAEFFNFEKTFLVTTQG